MSIEEQVFVVGHRNPDTDSICSAIAYANLCQRQGRTNVSPGRAGSLNRQAEFVLESVGQEPPKLLTDVFPRLRDVVDSSPATIDADAPLMQALDLMRQRDIRMLPVVASNRKPIGALILKRLTEHIFLPQKGKPIRQVLTSLGSIQSCLQATAANLEEGGVIEELDLFVGAMSVGSFQKHLQGTEPRRIVIITGDRREIHEHAIELGVRMLIITGGLGLDDDLLNKARAHKVSVLSSPFDTASSAMLARLSTPVRMLAESDVPQAHPNDRLDEIRTVLMHSSSPGLLVVDDEGGLYGVATKSNLLKPSPKKLILVDHNELSQAVPGAEQVDILEVIDHHRLGNFHTDAPIRFINQPLGSTCSVVATLFQQAGLEPDAKTAALMLAGLLSDTVLLKSPTATEVDRSLIPWLESCSGLDAREFGQKIFQAGSVLAAYSKIESLLTADFKVYEVDGRSFGIGQVEVVDFQEFEERRMDISQGLQTLAADRGLSLAGLLVTDIVRQNSQLVVQGDKGMIAAVGYPQIDANRFELKGVLSRKKQLMPHLLRAFKSG